MNEGLRYYSPRLGAVRQRNHDLIIHTLNDDGIPKIKQRYEYRSGKQITTQELARIDNTLNIMFPLQGFAPSKFDPTILPPDDYKAWLNLGKATTLVFGEQFAQLNNSGQTTVISGQEVLHAMRRLVKEERMTGIQPLLRGRFRLSGNPYLYFLPDAFEVCTTGNKAQVKALLEIKPTAPISVNKIKVQGVKTALNTPEATTALRQALADTLNLKPMRVLLLNDGKLPPLKLLIAENPSIPQDTSYLEPYFYDKVDPMDLPHINNLTRFIIEAMQRGYDEDHGWESLFVLLSPNQGDRQYSSTSSATL